MAQHIQVADYSLALHFDTVGSTMDVARDIVASESVNDGWCGVVTAAHQTAGRGRQGRSWLSSAGAFMGTFMFGTNAAITTLSGYSLAAGVAISEALADCGVMVQLKWPNDLVVVRDEQVLKLGGVLIEVQELQSNRCVLVGIGINLEQCPQDSVIKAISIREISDEAVGWSTVLERLSARLRREHLSVTSSTGLPGVLPRWRERCCFRSGHTVITADNAGEIVTGVYKDIGDTGALTLVVDGRARTFHSAHLVSITL